MAASIAAISSSRRRSVSPSPSRGDRWAAPVNGDDHRRPYGRDDSPSSTISRNRYPLAAALPSAGSGGSPALPSAGSGGSGGRPTSAGLTSGFPASAGSTTPSFSNSNAPYPYGLPSSSYSSHTPQQQQFPNHNNSTLHPQGPQGGQSPYPSIPLHQLRDSPASATSSTGPSAAGGRVTLPVLHLGSFSSLKLEDFTLSGGNHPLPSPSLSQNHPPSPTPGNASPFQAQQQESGRFRPQVSTAGGGYRTGSPSGSSPTDSLSPGRRTAALNGRSSPLAGHVDSPLPPSPPHQQRSQLQPGQQPSPNMSLTSPGIAGVGAVFMSHAGMPSPVMNGTEEVASRADGRATRERSGSGGRRGSQGSVDRGTTVVLGVGNDASERGMGSSPSNLKWPLAPPAAGNESRGMDQLGEDDDEDDDEPVRPMNDRDDHRQAVLREATINRRRTVIQDPTKSHGPIGPDQGAYDYDLAAREEEDRRRRVAAGMRSRQASSSGKLEMAGESPSGQGRRKSSQASLDVRANGNYAQPAGPEGFNSRASGTIEYGMALSPAMEQDERFEPTPMVGTPDRMSLEDADLTPIKKRALPVVPPLMIARSAGQPSSSAMAQENSRSYEQQPQQQQQQQSVAGPGPSSSSWQSRPAPQPPTSARKPSPAMLNGPERVSYVDAETGMDAIPGLMGEEGPYPSYARPQQRQQPQAAISQSSSLPGALGNSQLNNRTSQYQDISAGRPSMDKKGPAKNGGPPLRVKVPPPQEEICLECLMRDRDLMHVDVTTDGVWERESDADFQDRLEREKDFEARNQGRLEGQAMDAELARAMKWRGFSWEEEEGGSGLPEGFRGHLAGKLLESRLKELLLKFPSASAFRAKKMQIYLHDQSKLFGQAPPESFPDPDFEYQGEKPEGYGGPQPRSRPPRRETEFNTMPRQGERETSGQVPRIARATVYGSPNPGQENQYPDEELKRYQSHPQLLQQQPYATQPRRRAPSQRGDVAGRAVTMYAQSPTSSSAPSREPSQRGYREPPPGMTQQMHLDARKRQGASSPGVLEGFPPGTSMQDPQSAASLYANQHREDAYREFDQGLHQNEVPVRPFSFAVWAGRNGESGGYSAQSSPGPRTDDAASGHNVRSGNLMGRFGGSVTSFFGDSQGGVSGSMMDMHLGLDTDRNYYPNSAIQQPRSVSMASPSRPRFFGRGSRDSLVDNRQPQTPQVMNRVRSRSSMLDLASLNRSSTYEADFDDADGPEQGGVKKKKKGIKGFFKKLGKGGKRKSISSDSAGSPNMAGGSRGDEDPATMPLRPPPSLSFLVDSRVDRPAATQHGRSPSGSSLSGPPTGGGHAPSGTQSSGGSFQGPGDERQKSADARQHWQQQQRSVSAPGIVKSTSRTSLLSSSPTSSRYPYGQDPVRGPQQQSFGYSPGPGNRDSIASSFSGRRRGSVQLGAPIVGIDEEGVHDSAVEVLDQEGPRHWVEEPQAMPPLSRQQFREKAPSSISNSSGTLLPMSIESPGLPSAGLYAQPVMVAGPGNSSYNLPNQFAPPPDRQKNLPPLPPQAGMRQQQPGSGPRDRPSPGGSPDSFDAFFGNQGERYTTSPQMPQQANGGFYHSRQASVGQQSYMSSGQSSGSLARGGPSDTNDRQPKKTRSRFGLKGLFTAGLNTGKDDRGSANDRQFEQTYRSPSLDAGSWMGDDRSRDVSPRRAPGAGGNERYRQTYYQ